MNEKTKGYYFIVPLLGRPHGFFGDLLINAFIGNMPSEAGASQKIILQFENKILLEENEFILKFITENGAYKCKLRKPNDESIYFVFHSDLLINEIDLQKFLDGAYSKLSSGTKSRITRFLSKDHSIYKSLYPTKDDRKLLEERLGVELPADAEIMSKPQKTEIITTEDLSVESDQIFM